MPDTKDLTNRVADLHKLQLAKKKSTSQPNRKKESSNIPVEQVDLFELPMWPEAIRGTPNAFLRSALFGVARRGKRRYFERAHLESVEGLELRYTGARLDQADLDVWEMAIHLARKEPLGNKVTFSANSFLTALDRCSGKRDYEWLKTVAARLSATTLEITYRDFTYAGSLIDEFVRDELTKQYTITFNPRLLKLYQAGWSSIDWSVRQTLKGKPLALWVHGFYSTHINPYPMRVETIHRLCGSETQQTKHFKSELKDALQELKEAKGIIEWKIDDNNLVHVKPLLSARQVHSIRNQKSNP
jgi:hypothetical protein